MKATFAQVNIGEEFTMNDMRFIKVETVFTEGTCCIPHYNAYAAHDENWKVCIPFQAIVQRDNDARDS